MGNNWRSTTTTPRRREKPVSETQKTSDSKISNGLLKAACPSEESQESDGGNSDSDSDVGSICHNVSEPMIIIAFLVIS